MLNILWIAYDTAKQLHRLYHYLEKELAEMVNLMIWRKSGHIDYILRCLPVRPDFILLLNDIGRELEPNINGLSHTGIPVGLFVNDVHRFKELRRNYISKHKISHLFSVARERFNEVYPECMYKMEWFPHFAQTDIYRDYGMKKDISLLMTGAVNEVYPLRQRIVEAYEGDRDFVYHRHPGYQTSGIQQEDPNLTGKDYAKELNRAKIVFTCPSVFYYPVIKYFEVLACKSLLLAPTFPELEDLGFIPGYHFIPIHKDDFMEKASYYLENETERQQIAEQGYRFVRQHHTVKVRAKQLIHEIENILY